MPDILGLPDSLTDRLPSVEELLNADSLADRLPSVDELTAADSLTDTLPESDKLPIDSLAETELLTEIHDVTDIVTVGDTVLLVVLDTLGLPDSLTDELPAQDKLPAEDSLTEILPTSDRLPINSLADPELVKELLASPDIVTQEVNEL